MEWLNKFQAARESGEKVTDNKTDAILEKHWPQVQSVIREKVGPTALAMARDDQKVELLFKTVYAALPFPIHLAVKEAAFIKFCLAHRDKLLPPAEPTGAPAAK
jgi:hypothetical protein